MERFINRYFGLINTNLSPSATTALVNEFAAEIQAVVQHQRDRWGSGFWWRDIGNWHNQVSALRSFLSDRPGHMGGHILSEARFRNLLNGQNGRPNLAAAQLRNLTIRTDPAQGHAKLNGIDLVPGTPGVADPSNWNGNYLTGFPQTITAVPAPGYGFSKFTVNGVDRRENPLSFIMTGDTTLEVVFCGCDDIPCKCESPLPPYKPPSEPQPQNMAIGLPTWRPRPPAPIKTGMRHSATTTVHL